VTDEHRDATGQSGPHLVQRLAPLHDDVGHVQRRVGRDECVCRREVGLGEDEERPQPGVVRRDQAAVDQPGPRLRVRERRDDSELVGVGDDDPLDRVRVVSRAPQHRCARLDAHHPRQPVGLAREVTDEADPVAHDDALAPQLAGLHRRDEAGVDEAAVAAAVHGHDEALGRVVVPRPVLGPWTRAAARTDPHVVLVEVRTPPA
jgi:hypothetical protein